MLRTVLLAAVLVLSVAAQSPVVQAPAVQASAVQDPAVQDPAVKSAETEGFTQAELESLARDLQPQIEALRGGTFNGPVAVALADAASFRTYVQLRMQRMMPPDRLSSEEDLYKLLGLLPPDLSYMGTMMSMLESQVGGFYDPGEDRFYLMKSFSGGLARVILAHELTHALDDQRWDLDEGLRARMTNSDALFAYQAVVEGSGMAVMTRWMLTNMQKLSIEEVQKAGNLGLDGLGKVPPAMWKPLLAAYTRGAAFLVNSESAMAAQRTPPNPERIDEAFNNPPLSSEQILHPAKYWDERDDPIELHIDYTSLPEGLRVLGLDCLGEMGATLFTEKPERRKGLRSQMQAQNTGYATRAGKGWGGDRVVLIGKGKQRAAVWWSIWDTEKDAREFESATAEVIEHVDTSVAAWAKLRGLDGGASATFARAPELDAERGLRLVSSCGFSQLELDAILAGLTVSIVPPTKLTTPVTEAGSERPTAGGAQ